MRKRHEIFTKQNELNFCFVTKFYTKIHSIGKKYIHRFHSVIWSKWVTNLYSNYFNFYPQCSQNYFGDSLLWDLVNYLPHFSFWKINIDCNILNTLNQLSDQNFKCNFFMCHWNMGWTEKKNTWKWKLKRLLATLQWKLYRSSFNAGPFVAEF